MEAGIQQKSERENEGSIPTIKKKKAYFKIILFIFTFSTKLHKNITQVIGNLGIVEDNFFSCSLTA